MGSSLIRALVATIEPSQRRPVHGLPFSVLVDIPFPFARSYTVATCACQDPPLAAVPCASSIIVVETSVTDRPQSGALVHVQIVSSIAVEHFPIANTSLEMPSASLVSRRREGAGSLVERGGRISIRRAPHAAGKLDRRSNCHKSSRLCHNTRAASL